jgi:hypothetical protein
MPLLAQNVQEMAAVSPMKHFQMKKRPTELEEATKMLCVIILLQGQWVGGGVDEYRRLAVAERPGDDGR